MAVQLGSNAATVVPGRKIPHNPQAAIHEKGAQTLLVLTTLAKPHDAVGPLTTQLASTDSLAK